MRAQAFAVRAAALLLAAACLGTTAGCGGTKTPQSSTTSGSTPASDPPGVLPTDTTGTAADTNTTTQPAGTTGGKGGSTVSNTTVPTAGTKTTAATASKTAAGTKSEQTGHLSRSDTSVEPVRSLAEIMASLSAAQLTCGSYDREKYLTPYWKGNIVYNEAVNFIRDAKTGAASAPLLFTADKILEVRNAKLDTVYEEGKDYVYENGQLTLPEGSRIHAFSYGEIYFKNEKSGACFPLKAGGYTLFREGTYFHEQQIAVTYVHGEPWRGYKPAYQGALLPNVIRKLKSGEDVSIVYLGDSITKGGNASGMFGVAPKMPVWTDMVTSALKAAYPKAKITSFSASENGATTVQALKNLRTLCSAQKPDLVIIGFGMNDGTDKSLTPERFRSNIRSIMETNDALCGKPCDYLLLSTTLPNPEIVLGDAAYHTQYAEVLYQLERQGVAGKSGGVVVGDMTAVHQVLLQHKRFFDMTANNVNHPNDFLVRAYAQLVCTMLIE